jgi:membrane fusion protein (multidrug efflux system)
MLEEFYKRDAQGDIDKIFAGLVPGAPAVKQAEAKLQSAERDLDQAELNLRYCKLDFTDFMPRSRALP